MSADENKEDIDGSLLADHYVDEQATNGACSAYLKTVCWFSMLHVYMYIFCCRKEIRESELKTYKKSFRLVTGIVDNGKGMVTSESVVFPYFVPVLYKH